MYEGQLFKRHKSEPKLQSARLCLGAFAPAQTMCACKSTGAKQIESGQFVHACMKDREQDSPWS